MDSGGASAIGGALGVTGALTVTGASTLAGVTSTAASWIDNSLHIGGPTIINTGGGGDGFLECRNVYNAAQITLYPHGAVVASKNGSAQWVTPVSDERLKTNITTVNPAMASAELCALRLVSFDYTAEAAAALGITGHHTGWTGFLADEYDTAMSTLPGDRLLSAIDLAAPDGAPYHTIDTGRAAYCLYAAQARDDADRRADGPARLDAAGL
jgi:hypothetical protein